MNTYIEMIQKWDGIIAKSGRDADSFARELQTRIYSKIDIGKL